MAYLNDEYAYDVRSGINQNYGVPSVYKNQVNARVVRPRFGGRVGAISKADWMAQQQSQSHDDGGFWGSVMSWPVIGDALEIAGKVMEPLEPVFNAIEYPWKEIMLPNLLSPFMSDDRSTWDKWNNWMFGVMDWQGTQEARQAYKDWDSPKYLKGAMELANPMWLIPGAAAPKALAAGSKALAATRFISKYPKVASALGESGRTVRALGYTAGKIEAAEKFPARVVSKVTGKVFDVLPKTERTLMRRLPGLADDFIKAAEDAGRPYTPAQQAALRREFGERALAGLEKTGTEPIGFVQTIKRHFRNAPPDFAPTKRYTFEYHQPISGPGNTGLEPHQYLIRDAVTGEQVGTVDVAIDMAENATVISAMDTTANTLGVKGLRDMLASIEQEAKDQGRRYIDIIAWKKHAKGYKKGGFKELTKVPQRYRDIGWYLEEGSPIALVRKELPKAGTTKVPKIKPAELNQMIDAYIESERYSAVMEAAGLSPTAALSKEEEKLIRKLFKYTYKRHITEKPGNPFYGYYAEGMQDMDWAGVLKSQGYTESQIKNYENLFDTMDALMSYGWTADDLHAIDYQIQMAREFMHPTNAIPTNEAVGAMRGEAPITNTFKSAWEKQPSAKLPGSEGPLMLPEGRPVSEAEKLGIWQSELDDISDIIAKEINRIDPTRRLTGLRKVRKLNKLGMKRRPGFTKEMRANQSAIASKVSATINKLAGKWDDDLGRRTGGIKNPKTGQIYTVEEATYIAKAQAKKAGRLIDMTEGFDLTPEQAAELKFTQKEMDDIIDRIWNTDYVGKKGKETFATPYQAADAFDAFNQLVILQKPLNTSQRKLLAQALGDDTMAIFDRLYAEGKWTKALDIMNLPRAVLASWDMSAPFRQGMILQARFATSGRFRDLGTLYKNMFKAFAEEKWAIEMDDILRENPLYKDWIRNGGYHSPLVHGTLATREEQFLSNAASRYVPLVRRSERAYQTFLNQIRFKQYEHTVNSWERMLLKEENAVAENLARAVAAGKVSAETTIEEAIAKGVIKPPAFTRAMLEESKPALNRLINAASGRGQLNAVLEGNLGAFLNATLFSPRLLMSRIQFPLYTFGKNVPMVVKEEARKELLAFLSVGTGLLTTAYLAGASIEGDPRSADFGKIRIGNTRHDIWAGYTQFARFITQLTIEQRKSAVGEIIPQNRWDTFLRFMQSKTSPGTGLLVDILKGQDYMGDEIGIGAGQLSTQFRKRMVPLFVQDLADGIADSGFLKGSFITTPAFFGTGTQTYSNATEEARKVLSEQYGIPDGIWESEALNKAKKTLEPYYDIPEKYWGQNPQLEAIAEQISYLEKVNPPMAERILMGYPQIMQIREMIALERQRMLASQPEVQAALSMVNR